MASALTRYAGAAFTSSRIGLLRPCLAGKNLAFVRHAKKTAKKKPAKQPYILGSVRSKMEAETRGDWNKDELLSRLPSLTRSIEVHEATPFLFFHDAIAMLREHNSPEMNDNMDSIIELELSLDMRSDKATKFKANFSRTIKVPHGFDAGKPSTVLVFCESPEQERLALDAGATFAGGMELIKQLQKGDISYFEYSHIVSTPAMIPFVNKVRKILKDKYPDMKDGAISEEITEMVDRYLFGKTFSSKTDSGPDTATCTIQLGTLNMTDEELQDNLKAYLEIIESTKGYRKRSAEYGSFIYDIKLSAHGCGERFLVHADTAYMKPDQIEEWLKSNADERNKIKAEEIEAVITGVQRPLLKEEMYWGMTEEEIARKQASDTQDRITEQKRLMNTSEKQRKSMAKNFAHNQMLIEQETEKYEHKLAEVYRQTKLQRLSKEVRDQLDLERQFREKVHI